MIVTAAAEQELILIVLPAYGTWPPAARVQARWLVEADLRGVGSHGLQRLPMLVRRIERGFIRQEAVSAYLDAVRATPVQEGVAALQVPGDRVRAERTRRQQAGVEIPDPVWHKALELARGPPGAGKAGQPAATLSGHNE